MEKSTYADHADAYVGIHKDGKNRSLGRLANAELRLWKKEAHTWFDPIWQKIMREKQFSKLIARTNAYTWLAEQLGIHRDDCHIGMFDVEQCKKAVQVCKEYYVQQTAK